MNSVLITGVTGVVGSKVASLFLSEENTKLYLLVRAKSKEHLEQRISELIKFWNIAPDDQTTRARIKAFSGDVSLERFGLHDSTYEELTKKITCIVHSAADISMRRPLDEARKCSVGAAKNIIELAAQCKQLKKIEAISTVGIAGRQRETLLERRSDSDNRQFHNTYEQAKAEAEQLFFAAIEAGLPITIHRPSMIVGDSETGSALNQQIFYYLCKFLSGQNTKSVLPRMDGVRLDIIPVDYVAKAIYLSSSRADSVGRVLHLCSGPRQSIDVVTLAEKVRESWSRCDLDLPAVTYLPTPIFNCLLYLASLAGDGKQKRAIKNLSIFLDYARDRQIFENKESEAYLSSLGLTLPKVESYLDKVLTNQLSCSRQIQLAS